MKISYCFTDSDEPCGLLKCIASCFDDDVSLAVSVCLGRHMLLCTTTFETLVNFGSFHTVD